MSGKPLTPGLGRRLLCLIYDLLLLTALVLFAGGIAAAIAQLAGPDNTRLVTQAVVMTLCPAYFVWQWLRGGQTLPMKTWRIRLVSQDGGTITPVQSLLRLVLAMAGYPCLGITVLWALIDRDGQFLHDRLSGTQLIRSD